MRTQILSVKKKTSLDVTPTGGVASKDSIAAVELCQGYQHKLFTGQTPKALVSMKH